MPRVEHVEVKEDPAKKKAAATGPVVDPAPEPNTEASEAPPIDIFPYEISSDGKMMTVTDRIGRVLQFKKLGALDEANIETAVASEPNGVNLSQITSFMQKITIAAALVSINGSVEQPWMSIRDLKLRIQTLDNEGLYAGAMMTPMLSKGMTQAEIDAVAKKYQAAPK